MIVRLFRWIKCKAGWHECKNVRLFYEADGSLGLICDHCPQVL